MFLRRGYSRAAAGIVLAALFMLSFQASADNGGAASGLANVGYVDFKKALNDVSDGKAVRERLKGEFTERQQKLDVLQEDLKKLRGQIDAARGLTPAAEFKSKEEAYENKFFELQQMHSAFKNEMAAREASLTGQILENLKKIVRDIGEEKSYSFIIEKSQDVVVYAANSVDITGEVIERYDKGRRGKRR
jgi:outer membrane protein